MADLSQTTHENSAAVDKKIRVMLVDDSVIVRGVFERTLNQSSKIEVVAKAADGLKAIKLFKETKPAIDVIVLDIEMPQMDGLEALPKLLEIDPNVQIIMASSLTKRNADISLRALSAGAKDYIPKPSSMPDMMSADDFKRDLLEKVEVLGSTRRKLRQATPQFSKSSTAPRMVLQQKTALPNAYKLRSPGKIKPNAISISSSTGGPQALTAFLNHLPKGTLQPIFITQHMPKTFTEIFATHLSKNVGRICCEAKDGDIIEGGVIYLAPGDYHMTIKDENGAKVIRLNQDPPVNFCRPSADPMLDSLCDSYGAALISIVLTGMGNDGCAGSQNVIEHGGTVVAQDEESSAVWGMPGAVAKAGICSEILPLDKLATSVSKLI